MGSSPTPGTNQMHDIIKKWTAKKDHDRRVRLVVLTMLKNNEIEDVRREAEQRVLSEED